MARPNLALVQALRETALRLAEGADYQWTHLGACNCGHLAQTVSKLTSAEIRRYALERGGEWRDQALHFCSSTGHPMDLLLASLLDLGMSREDIAHLERLSCRKVLERLPVERRLVMDYRNRQDVVLYMTTWAELLEEQLPPRVRTERAPGAPARKRVTGDVSG